MTAFEWDEAKRHDNLEKHGIDFIRAAKIFRNRVIEAVDDRADYGEARIRAIGAWQDEVLVVVYTWRGMNRRIISAWKAGQRDASRYHERAGRTPR